MIQYRFAAAEATTKANHWLRLIYANYCIVLSYVKSACSEKGSTFEMSLFVINIYNLFFDIRYSPLSMAQRTIKSRMELNFMRNLFGILAHTQ